MGISLTSKFSANSKKSRIVNLPEENQSITVALAPEENIVLNFPLEGVTSHSEGDTLVLECPGGQCIYLPGAFAQGGGLIMLSNGKLVTVDELLELKAEKQTLDTAEGNLEGGIDRLGSLGTDQFQRNTEPREAPNNQAVLSQGGSSGASSGANAGSGVGEFRSEAGSLVEGIWALPDQLTDHWGWSSANEPKNDGILSGDSGISAPQPTTSVVVSGAAVNESATHITFSIDVKTTSTPGCTVSFTVGGGSAIAGDDYDPTNLEYYDGTSWVPLTPGLDGVYTVTVPGGTGSIQIQMPLVDDALSEANETIGLTVTGITDSTGAPLTDYTSDTKLGGSATIVEDTKINEGLGPNEIGQKDGPVISVVRTNANDFADETDIPGAAPSVAHETSGKDRHIFALEVKNHYDSQGGPVANFAGVPDSGSGNNVPLQDIVIAMRLGGDATSGMDYEFKPSDALQTLIDTGHASYTPPDANGNFTLVLHGIHDASGNLHPTDGSYPLFDMSTLGDLTFQAIAKYDTAPELPERVEVAIVNVSGNESSKHPTNDKASGYIADDNTKHDGPALTLHSPTTTTESASPDPANAPADKTDWHEIKLHVPAPSPIRATITLDGMNNDSIRYNGSNESSADFKWAGEVQYSTDNGTTWHTMPAANCPYSAGECDLTIPANATNVRFGVTTIDDMRETSDAANEGYTVKLELVNTGSGTDCGAVLHDSGGTTQSNLTNTTTITEETRPSGSDHLNPADFDGPYVTIEAGTANAVPESGNSTLPYSVKLNNPDGSGSLFDGTTEGVEVTLTVTGGDGFQIQDLFAPTNASGAFTGDITCQAYDALGNTVGSSFIVTVTGNGTTLSSHGDSFSFKATLPPGAAEIRIEIPVNDDPLGGTSSGTSDIERLNETVTLTITDVKGSEARVDGNNTASVTITDDTVSSNFEGVQVGLSWQGSNDTAKTIDEGDTGVILLRLFQNNGNDLSGSPYQNYMGNSKIPEDLSVKLSFANTPGNDADMALKFTTQFLALVDARKITVTIGSTTYTNSTGLNGLDISGDFTVTLKGGQFDLSNDLGSLSFNAHTFGDNVQEYQSGSGGYGTVSNEQFGLTVTEVSGNESSIKTGANTATGTIIDKPDGLLSITGGELDVSNGSNPGSWDFTIAVKYTDNEKTNHPGNSVSAGGISGTVVKVPGEDTVITIRVTDGDVMEHGDEYTITAYDLFLSINGLDTDDVSLADYNGGLFGGDVTPEDYWIIVKQNGNWLNNGSGKDSTTFDLEVPKEYWETTTGSGGTIDLTISQGDRVGAITTNRDGGFTVSIEPPANGKGEISGLGTPSSTAAEEDDTLSIHMTLDVTKTVYENASADGEKDNIATFTMKFAQFRNGSEVSTPFCMGREFSFEFTLRGNSTADLNDNTGANTLYPDLKDFALCDANGDISTYSDINGLTAKLQAILTDQYGTTNGTPNVSISLVSSGGDIKFKVTVSEGVDLSEGIDLHFVAMDNYTTDGNRTVNGVISNITCADEVIDIQITQDGGTATITDETRNLSGFAIALGDGYGYEKTVGDNALDGNGTPLDGKVHIPVYAYILSNGHMPGLGADQPGDGDILSYSELLAIYTAKKGPLESFEDFVTANFGPTQPITITVSLNNKDAVVTEDYKDTTTQTLDPNDWELKIVDKGNGEYDIYFQHKTGCTVETIDDTFSMVKDASGDKGIHFEVAVDKSENNESRPVETGSGGRDDGKLASGHDSSATGTILDYHNGPSIIELGPVGGKIYEPIDNDHGKLPHDPGEQHVANDKASSYTIKLNNATKEDMVIWLDISDNGVGSGNTSTGAVYGEDYGFGTGLYQFKGGKYFKFNADGTATELSTTEIAALPPYISNAGMDGNYFVVIKDGKSSASFDMLVKDDNKTENDDYVNVKVVDVQGGEATYTESINTGGSNNEIFTIPWAKDVPYEYYVNGERVLVDPSHDCYYVISSGTKVGWDPANPPAWSLKPNAPGYAPEGTVTGVDNDLQIVDDGNGPLVQFDRNSFSIDDTAADDGITISMDHSRPVTSHVKIRLDVPGYGKKTVLLEIPANAENHTFSATEILAALNEARAAETPPKASLSSADFAGTSAEIVRSGIQVEWDNPNAVAPTITVSLEDYCQEAVTIKLDLSSSSLHLPAGTYLTLTIPAGCTEYTFTPQAILNAWNTANQTNLTTLPRGSFNVQIVGSSNGETDHSDEIIRVIIREGDTPAIRLHDLENIKITEGWMRGVAGDAGDAIVLKMNVPGSSEGFSINGGLTFSVTINNSGLLSNDTATLYTVTLSKEALDHLQKNGATDYTVKIVINGSVPNVQFIDPDTGNPVDFSSVTGPDPSVNLWGKSSLPEALGDYSVGDSNGVGMSISDVESSPAGTVPAYIDEKSLAYVGIKDGTSAKLCLFVKNADNTWSLVTDDTIFKENSGTLTLKAALILVDKHGHFVTVDGSDAVTAYFDADGKLYDAAGNEISGDIADIKLTDVKEVTTEEALEFDVDYGDYSGAGTIDGNAAIGQDYIGSDKVRIEKGESSGEFTVTITNDDLTEGKEGLDLSLKATDETKDNAGHILGQIIDKSGDVYGGASVIIEDDMSGPIIRWGLSATTVAENGELTLSWESFSRDAEGNEGGREIVAENVQLEFEITPKADFTLDEIESITITVMENGVPKTYTYLNGSAEFDALIHDNNDGTWTLKPTFIGGTGLGGLTITFKDDVISEIEANEGFDITLKNVVGSEAHVGKDSSNADITQTVDVTETQNGPIVDLIASSASEENREVIYTLKLTGGKNIEEPATVKITLNDESADMVNGTVLISGPKGTGNIAATITETSPGSGIYEITLPEGIGAGNYTITFPIKDNAALEEGKFGVSLGTPEGGELGLAEAVKFETKFVNETGGDTTNGGTKTLCIFTEDSVANCDGQMSYAISGITKPEVIGKIEISFGGTTITLEQDLSSPPEPGKWYWNDTTKQIEILSKPREIYDSYEFTITFAKEGSNGVTASDLSDSKLNMTVEDPKVVNREVSITVSNETTHLDGPKVGLELSGTPVEGDVMNKVSGTVKVALPNNLLEGQTLLDDIVIVLKVEPADAAFSLEGQPAGVTAAQVGDTVTITIPASVPNTGGGFNLGFTIPVPDNSTKDNPEYKITVTDVHGADKNNPVYEKYEIDTALGHSSVSVTPSGETTGQEGPKVGVAFDSGSFTEGGDITGSLAVVLTHCTGEGSVTLDDIVITLTVEPSGAAFSLVNPPAGCAFVQTGDTVVVTIDKGTNLSDCADLGFKIPVPDNSLNAQNPGYKVTINSVTGKDGATDVYEKYEKDSTNADTGTVYPGNESSGLEGPVVTLENTTQGTPVEGATDGTGDITGNIKVDLSHALASEGENTLDDIVITLQIVPKEAASGLIIDGTPSWCSVSAPDANGYVTVTIDAGTPLADCAEIGFTLPVPDNSSSAVNPEYSVTIIPGGVTGSGDPNAAYEKYEVGTADSISVTPANETDPADQEGLTASLIVARDSGAGDAIAGTLEMTLHHAAGEGDATLVPLEVTIKLAGLSDYTGITFTDFNGMPGNSVNSNGEVTITLPAGTNLPSGGFTFSFEGVPDANVGAPYTVTVSIDDNGLYESCVVTPGTGVEVMSASPIMMPLAALALFADESAELDGMLEAGLQNLAAMDGIPAIPGNGDALSSGDLPGADATQSSAVAQSSAWANHTMDAAPAHDEQALLMMKIMTETGPA